MLILICDVLDLVSDFHIGGDFDVDDVVDIDVTAFC